MKLINVDVIICCGINRSGSTWSYLIAKDLFQGNDFINLRFLQKNELGKVEESLRLNKNKMHLIKMHDCKKDILELDKAYNIKYIYTHRDLRGVIASLMLKSKKNFGEVVNMPYLNSSMNSFNIWKQFKNITYIKYSDIIENNQYAVQQIADSLSVKCGIDKIKKISLENSLENQKSKIAKFKSKVSLGIWIRRIFNKSYFKIDDKTLLHTNHITNGKLDNWKGVITKEEEELIIEKYSKWMKFFDYAD